MTWHRLPLVFLIPLLAALPVPGRAGDPPEKAKPAAAKGSAGVSREEIESLEAQLDRAVDRVSVPHAGMLLGRADSARGYRLPGYGVVFVLTPRSLPAEGAVFVLRRGGPRPRHVHVEVRPRIVDAEREQKETRDIEVLERQVLVLQREAEEARRAAEEDMERIMHDVRLRLPPAAQAEPAPGTPSPEVAPLPGGVPVPTPWPLVEAAPPAPPAAVAPPVPPTVPSPAEAPMPPPWKSWFGTEGPRDERAPDKVVADVRAALVQALESQSGRVPGLGADEFVTVAVDFVPGGFFASHARPAKTLVVRARVRDLEARARGALAPEELRRRVEVVEY